MARVTSRDVARAAGVSQATVSFVLNGRSDQGIADRTRQHVLETARQLGYVPSAAARSLRTGRSAVILCLAADFPVNQAMEEFKVELSQVLGDAGFTCVYLHYAGARQPLEDLWQHVHPAAVVAFGELALPDADIIRNAGIGLIDAVFGPDNSQNLIGLDQRDIGRMQVRYLAAQGHRRIGFAAVADPRHAWFCTPRSQGTREACRGLDLPDPVVVVLDDEADSASAAVTTWRQDGVTAVAAFNDLAALAIINACHLANLAVPQDLAVIGVDDLEVGSLITPRLTTIALNLAVPAHVLAQHISELVGATRRTQHAMQQREQVLQLVKRESA